MSATFPENTENFTSKNKIEKNLFQPFPLEETKIGTKERILTSILPTENNSEIEKEKTSFYSVSPEEEKSPEFYQAMTDFFREIYSNTPYSQFVFHENDPTNPISPQEAFGQEKQYFSLQELDRYKLKEGEHFWMDPNKTHEILTNKLSNSHTTFLYNHEKKQVEGIVSGKQTSVREVFENEEIKNPLLYTNYKNSEILADEERFYEKIKYHFDLDPESNIFYISNMSLHPGTRRRDTFENMMKDFFNSLSEEELGLYIFEETSGEGTSYTILRAVMERVLYGILENDHPVCAGKLNDSANHFLSGNYKYQLIQHLKKEKTIEQKGYLPSETDHDHVIVQEVGEHEKGVFAKERIQKGEVIAIFEGEKYKAENALDLPQIMVNHAIQVGEHEYVHGHNGLAELVNHSCNPNCGIKNYTEIVAKSEILPGEEIAWDYRMTEDSNWNLEKCLCGSSRCTGIVGSFKNLPKPIQDQYLKEGVISDWILEKYKLSR